MQTVKVIFIILHQFIATTLNNLSKLIFSLFHLVSKHIETSQHGSGSVFSHATSVFSRIRLRKIILTCNHIRFYQLKDFTLICLGWVELFVFSLNLFCKHGNAFTPVPVQAEVIIGAQETSFSHCLLLQLGNIRRVFRNIRNVIQTLVGIADTFVAILPFTFGCTVCRSVGKVSQRTP